LAKNEQSQSGKPKEPPPGAVHNMAHSVGVRCIGAHFTNGRFTLHLPNGGYCPNVTGSEAMDILEEVRVRDEGPRVTDDEPPKSAA
jgi:hypothetical protein